MSLNNQNLNNLDNIDKPLYYDRLHIDRNYNWLEHKDLDKMNHSRMHSGRGLCVQYFMSVIFNIFDRLISLSYFSFVSFFVSTYQWSSIFPIMQIEG